MRLLSFALVLSCSCVSSGQEPRYLNFESGVSIDSRLSPNDRFVVVEKNVPPLLGEVPGALPAKDILEGNTLHAAAVLVVRLTNRESVLTPAGDWIVTRFQGQVLEQLKPRPLTLLVEDFALETSGGSLTIGSTRVEANVFWGPEFQVNRRYLVFPRTRKWPEQSVRAYEIGPDDKLKNVTPGFDPEVDIDNLHGFPWAKARQIILVAPPRGRTPR